MRTRKQYLSGVCTHEEYYGQFVDETIMAGVRRLLDYDQLFAAFQTDEHFNNIPLSLWDGSILLTRTPEVISKMHAAGDYLTMATSVCILKEAARQIVTTHS